MGVCYGVDISVSATYILSHACGAVARPRGNDFTTDDRQ